ncbi:hypothetical protein V8E52_004277 [Russula decolorans]
MPRCPTSSPAPPFSPSHVTLHIMDGFTTFPVDTEPLFGSGDVYDADPMVILTSTFSYLGSDYGGQCSRTSTGWIAASNSSSVMKTMPSSSRSSQVMDYFLLAGIRNMRHGNCDNIRCNTLCVISPPEVHMPLQPHAHGPLHHQRAAAVEQPHMVHCTMHRKANLKQVREGVLPEEDTGDQISDRLITFMRAIMRGGGRVAGCSSKPSKGYADRHCPVFTFCCGNVQSPIP